jgi:hypothetical protein
MIFGDLILLAPTRHTSALSMEFTIFGFALWWVFAEMNTLRICAKRALASVVLGS